MRQLLLRSVCLLAALAAAGAAGQVRGTAEEPRRQQRQERRRLMVSGIGGGYATSAGVGDGLPSVVAQAGGKAGLVVGRAGKASKASKGGRSIKGSKGGFREGLTDAICTCMSCTGDVIGTDAGGYTCGERIDYLLQNEAKMFPTTATACHQVAGLEFPGECGACDPFACDGRAEPDAVVHCNCETCTSDIWNTDAGGYTCGARISWAQIVDQASETDACTVVAGQYSQCALCDPNSCVLPVNPSPTIAGRAEPTVAPVSAAPVMAAPVTAAPVASPVTAAPVTATPTSAARTEPTAFPLASETPAPSARQAYCGCSGCADSWSNDANGLTCGQRISWLIGTNIGEEAACRVVGGQEYPDICGACNPDTCDGRSEPTAAAVTTAAPVTAAPVAATPTTAAPVQPTTAIPTSSAGTSSPTSEPAPTAAASELYCFPPSTERKRYTNVWDDFYIEAKDGGTNITCGPGGNSFDDSLVSLDQSDELTLSFRYSDGLWHGSEVRILPASGSYTYGKFSYSIKEVRVLEGNGTLIDNVLPVSLVVGMFTWDPTYNSTDPEGFEVDMEISQFGNSSNPDAQFLLQPPQAPHYYRFSTGTSGEPEQAPQTYEFTWLPTSVTWDTTAGGGQTFEYTTEDALAANQIDRIQCIPPNIEARVSLWSIRSARVAPDGLTEDQYVEVIINNFDFIASNMTGVADGEACSKACQCLSGSCQDFVCVSS